MKNISQTIKTTIAALILVGGISYAIAWTGPAYNNPQEGNVDAPINTGIMSQTKHSAFSSTELITAISTASTYCLLSSIRGVDTTDCISSWTDAVPRGAVIAFNLSTCPPHWSLSDGTAGTVDLRGVFVRGLDSRTVNGGSKDVEMPQRALGSYEDDELQSTSGLALTGNAKNANLHAGTGAITWGNEVWSTTGSKQGAETRPKNRALLYCQKD